MTLASVASAAECAAGKRLEYSPGGASTRGSLSGAVIRAPDFINEY